MTVHTLQIPNPFFEGRNRVYVIRSDPVTIVDTGIATQRAYEVLVRELKDLGLELRDIGRVILTHKHIDHIGNAWRVQQQSGGEILIHDSEVHAIGAVDPQGEQFQDLVRQRLREWQVPEKSAPPPSTTIIPKWEIEAASPTPLVDGQRIDLGGCGELEVIHTPGHTMGSVCLKFGRRLFSGDHVLPDISPNIGGGDMRQRGLLNQYLKSLQRIMDIAEDIDQVLPGHGDPFQHLTPRCHELLDHHRQRLRQVEAILRQKSPQSAYEIAQRLFGELREFHVVLGCAEALAHVEYLEDDGLVTCEQGLYRWNAA